MLSGSIYSRSSRPLGFLLVNADFVTFVLMASRPVFLSLPPAMTVAGIRSATSRPVVIRLLGVERWWWFSFESTRMLR
ncbi:hypothetical protein ACFX13_000963 [Malus domestica]